MSVEPGEPPSRPAIVGPVLIAAVFLAVIGASVGFVLGDREKDDNGGRGGDNGAVSITQDPQPPPPPPEPGPPPPPPPQQGEPATPDRCPPQTVRLAGKAGASGGLERKLYIRTGGSEVWICNDRDGRLFYQGHRGRPGEPFEAGNSLFLTDVATDGDGYVATNRAGEKVTTYRVSVSELVIEGKSRQVEPVEYHEP